LYIIIIPRAPRFIGHARCRLFKAGVAVEIEIKESEESVDSIHDFIQPAVAAIHPLSDESHVSIKGGTPMLMYDRQAKHFNRNLRPPLTRHNKTTHFVGSCSLG
jgi:hypothetical protein